MVSRIQCNKLQYRDTHLVETNQDELKDLIGGLYSSSADLRIDISNQDLPLSQGFENATNDKNEEDSEEEALCLNFPTTTAGTQSLFQPSVYDEEQVKKDDGQEEEITTEIWRPPTPPKISPVTKESKNMATLFGTCSTTLGIGGSSEEKSTTATPSPPQLSSVNVSTWNNEIHTEREEYTKASTKSNNLQGAPLGSNSYLNETFDVSVAANIHVNSSNEVLHKKNESIHVHNEASTTNNDSCLSDCKTEHPSSGSVESIESLNGDLDSFDATIVLKEPTVAQLVQALPLAEETSTRFTSTVHQNPTLVTNNKETTMTAVFSKNNTTPNEESFYGDKTKNSIMTNSTDIEYFGNNTKSNSKIQEDSAVIADRRGTFTVPDSSVQNVSPIVAIVPPNKRRSIETEITSEEMQNHTVNVHPQHRAHSDSIDSSTINHLSITEITNSFSKEPQVSSMSLQTPGKRTPPLAPSSASERKRGLKRAGPGGNVENKNASTSNLLKSLIANRPLAKTKTAAVNSTFLAKIAVPQPTSNMPSYMAATASSSRKLNLAQTGLSYNENEEPKGHHLSATNKDVVG